MVAIAIVYFSGQGHTHQMAAALAQGVEAAGGTPHLLRITGEQIVNGRWQDDSTLATLKAADGIAFGSPTYMGGVAGQFKCFLDAASETWFHQGWKDKIAGGFTHSSSPSGDKQGTLLYLAINAAQHGMLWVGAAEMTNPESGVNRLGSFMGVMGNSDLDMSGAAPKVDPGDLESAQRYGQRLVTIAQKVA
ncbi:flavodoxin family protein [Leptothoe sp. PORK10 BA2]|uniref:flavodoxin family protein n=1 Tax=Leptothoe sp. PORK10 BA2 TaxID=3110254 RepID=UPI002B219021|nr:flavodoxin family protein [Leptothoe sp. PORK10 BA2]MEA5464477.1 flavodoxin family protein [Leptothoe sp. PORK10 BA2]